VASYIKGVIASSLLAVFCSPALAQKSATVHGPEFVKAGENCDVVVTIDRAPDFTGALLHVSLQGPKTKSQYYQQYTIALKPGKTEYLLTIPVPGAATGGSWSVGVDDFTTGAGEQFPLPSTKYSFQVIANENLVYPTRADVGMRPSQAQLLRTEAIHLQAQIQDLKGQILEHKSDSKLTSLLRENIGKAIQALNDTEQQYRSLDSSSKQEDSKVFFDDLRTNYRQADTELKAQDIEPHSRNLLLVASPQRKAETAVYPVVAQAVLRAFEHNELAYITVADAQSLTFDLEVASFPTGAAVSFRRRGDDFKKSSSPTNSTIKALIFAVWIIRFEKDGFRPVDREFDPWTEHNRAITVELPEVN
jgi:hypothetical protein